MSLERILVGAGEAVLDVGWGDHLQPGLAFISQPSSQILWKSRWPHNSHHNSHFQRNSCKCRKKFFFRKIINFFALKFESLVWHLPKTFAFHFGYTSYIFSIIVPQHSSSFPGKILAHYVSFRPSWSSSLSYFLHVRRPFFYLPHVRTATAKSSRKSRLNIKQVLRGGGLGAQWDFISDIRTW